ncbi:MAG TPA: metalloregulator ArsR/SmtB family transcription factor [Actinomycetota bacterium]|nr:metalloregulator ArsR/SmtB family transcription factor [Actinomycetota bacterium]
MVQGSVAELDHVFHALSDPTRRAILTRLAGGELSLSELATPFPMSLTAVSKHLKVLEEARLVSRRRRGRESRCRLEPGPLSEAWEWIDHYRAFWEARLESLDRYFESTRRDE